MRLRQESKMQSLCLIAMSGYGCETYTEQARSARFDYHLLQPIELNQLIRHFDRASQDLDLPRS